MKGKVSNMPNYYLIEYKEGLVKKDNKLLLFETEFEALNYIDEYHLEEAIVRLADEDDMEKAIIYGKPSTPDIVIRYEWTNKTNYTKNCIVVVNMTKKMFYTYKISLVSNEKLIKVYNNNTSLDYYIDLKDKASFSDLVTALRKTNFVEI